MVLIHLKKGDKSQFLHEATTTTPIDQLTRDLVFLNNQKVKVEKLIDSVKGLLEYGPLKPEGVRGLTMAETFDPAFELLRPDEKELLAISFPGVDKVNDPTGYRTGLVCSKEAAEKLTEISSKAKQLVSNSNPDLKKPLLKDDLKEIVMLFKGAVMIAYPGYYGLPDWDPVLMILEDKMNYLHQFPDCEYIDENKTVLWWAKKELMNGQSLASYVGKNEKTKVVIKMMEKGKGAPLAEPIIDKETHSKMLSFYHKKQEEMKRLEEDNEDDYMNAEWANSQNLKNHLVSGGREIKYRNGLGR